jgi:hypothetical protein
MVFTYVDGEDPIHLQKRRRNEQLYNDEEIHPERSEGKSFKSLYNNVKEITFSVRSVLKYLPWIRTIFIVTDQQIPPIDQHLLDSGKVRIVDHREIIPARYLPTFNPNVIESGLHNIHGLSDIFLYNNDDFFYFSSVSEDAFFTLADDGQISLKLYAYPAAIRHLIRVVFDLFPSRGLIANNYTFCISNSFSRLRRTQFPIKLHNIIVPKHMTWTIRKSTAMRVEQELTDILHGLRKYNFRVRKDLSYSTLLLTMEKLWHPEDSIDYMIFNNTNKFRMFDFNRCNNASQSAKLWGRIATSNASFACLNNIKQDHYERFIAVMKQKGLGDPILQGYRNQVSENHAVSGNV